MCFISSFESSSGGYNGRFKVENTPKCVVHENYRRWIIDPGLSVYHCSFISLCREKRVMFDGVQQRARVLATPVHARPQTCFGAPDLMQTRAMSQIAFYYNYNYFKNKRDFFV